MPLTLPIIGQKREALPVLLKVITGTQKNGNYRNSLSYMTTMDALKIMLSRRWRSYINC